MKLFGMKYAERAVIFACALLLSCMWCGAGHAALSADDFLPPVQAEAGEREALLAVKDEASVKTAVDPVLNLEVTTAPTLQDSLNKIAEKPKQGCRIIAEPGGGYAFAATGRASYSTEGQSVTMARVLQRNAYVMAFMSAKSEMTQTVGEIVVRGADDFGRKIETLDSKQEELRNLETDLSEEQLQSVRKVLKGYVTYSVNDDGKNVYVTIVSSSKTRGKFSRNGTDGVTAGSLREGLNSVITEIKNGFVPPVGGRFIQVPGTGEVAFVGFGSSVVRYDRDEDVQEELKLQAERIAGIRAVDALTGIILGDDVSWQAHVDEDTKSQVNDFERLQASDQTVKDSAAEIKAFEERQRTARNTLIDETHIRSLRQGVLPPGIMRETILDDDEYFAYGIAVYIPSLTDAARNAAKEMDEAQLVEPPRSGRAGSAGQTAAPAPKLKRGPSGVVEQDF